MKKLIAILFLFVSSLLIGSSQNTETNYVDTLKKVTVSVTSDTKQQIAATNNLQKQLIKVIDSQITVNDKLKEGITGLMSEVSTYNKEIEKRNKSDGKLITDKFNYPIDKVKHTIRIERWLNFITWIVCAIYILYLINSKSVFSYATYGDGKRWPILLVQCLIHSLLAIFAFYFVLNVLTLLFNGDYYIIKELLSLYT